MNEAPVFSCNWYSGGRGYGIIKLYVKKWHACYLEIYTLNVFIYFK